MQPTLAKTKAREHKEPSDQLRRGQSQNELAAKASEVAVGGFDVAARSPLDRDKAMRALHVVKSGG